MSLSPESLKTLAMELAAAMPEPPPRRFEIVAGAMIRSESMEIARTYERATPMQRRAVDAVIASWRLTP